MAGSSASFYPESSWENYTTIRLYHQDTAPGMYLGYADVMLYCNCVGVDNLTRDCNTVSYNWLSANRYTCVNTSHVINPPIDSADYKLWEIEVRENNDDGLTRIVNGDLDGNEILLEPWLDGLVRQLGLTVEKKGEEDIIRLTYTGGTYEIDHVPILKKYTDNPFAYSGLYDVQVETPCGLDDARDWEPGCIEYSNPEDYIWDYFCLSLGECMYDDCGYSPLGNEVTYSSASNSTEINLYMNWGGVYEYRTKRNLAGTANIEWWTPPDVFPVDPPGGIGLFPFGYLFAHEWPARPFYPENRTLTPLTEWPAFWRCKGPTLLTPTISMSAGNAISKTLDYYYWNYGTELIYHPGEPPDPGWWEEVPCGGEGILTLEAYCEEYSPPRWEMTEGCDTDLVCTSATAPMADDYDYPPDVDPNGPVRYTP